MTEYTTRPRYIFQQPVRVYSQETVWEVYRDDELLGLFLTEQNAEIFTQALRSLDFACEEYDAMLLRVENDG